MKKKLIELWERIYGSNLVMGVAYQIRNRGHKLNIMDTDATLAYIDKHQCSVARFGEGEFELMLEPDWDLGFQKHNALLAKQLESVFDQQSDDLLICIPYALNAIYGRTQHSRSFWYQWSRRNNQHHRIVELIRGHTHPNTVFGDTQISRPYIAYKSAKHGKRVFPKLKKLWDGQDILFVEGEKTRLGVGNDLFDNARSIQRILCPPTNAFDCYDRIVEAVEQVWDGQLILLALGPTATILAADFSQRGMRAIDIGHLDIEYEWYRSGATAHDQIHGKFTNEADGGNVVGSCEDVQYIQQIVRRVL